MTKVFEMIQNYTYVFLLEEGHFVHNRDSAKVVGAINNYYKINNKHLVTGPEGNSEFCFPRISMFPETKSRETLRFEGNKIHCFPRDQSLRWLTTVL